MLRLLRVLAKSSVSDPQNGSEDPDPYQNETDSKHYEKAFRSSPVRGIIQTQETSLNLN